MQTDHREAVALAITGASGSVYGLRLLQQLLAAGRKVYLMLSDAGQVVIPLETGLELPAGGERLSEFLTLRYGAAKGQLQVLGRQQWTAPVASGSGAPGAMVICPCSTGTLSAVAAGASNNLIERAADVAIKEGRKLILVPRETPVSAIHLENMLKLARLGVCVMPASPGFYHCPQQIDQLIDFMVARILDHLGIEHRLAERWGIGRESDGR